MKLPALISVIAKFDPRGESAVENLTRELRRGGMITQGKRGVGAPDMTATDVTNVLLASATRQAKDAPNAVELLRNGMLVAEWEHDDRRSIDDFLDSLPISSRITDGERVIRAGLFLDALIDEIAREGAIVPEGDAEALIDIGMEVFDPFTGTGAVTIYFNKGWESEVMLRFWAADDKAPLGIQTAAVIHPLVLHYITDEMRKGR